MSFPVSPARAPGLLGVGGVVAIAAGALLVLLLQFLPPTNEISPLRRTISEYGLSTNKWIFNLALVLVALGSAVLFAVHALRRTLPASALLAGAVWTVSLLVIVAFPKTNWAVGPSAGGTVHRVASVVGFVCLPVGLLLASGRVFGDDTPWLWVARVLALTSLGWFALILTGVVVMLSGGGPWWTFVPLGLVQRLMALTDLLAVATLAVPLLRSP
ncbi:hypothetical protein FHX82_006367 [Amycolatopsis bartoniae]|uniref:DUF998 domain-containing protein n=1 Tax=Amycolatopsis bartoniae TaxID=941986 RepID=A0A8H9ISY6_9PSEU|nr:DUF998 domain-containing protein [Amycolatopsis bartoniae]MBB2939281.1 hypothetical protein [Amycolatopsis bartoniae]TVT08737.1 DUF998 domain-containing protein [Amycolatopsis bartoniae]GHF37608.1 hypothetical protein GCM10017566_08500 [Amycolatopsis bartoniae]